MMGLRLLLADWIIGHKYKIVPVLRPKPMQYVGHMRYQYTVDKRHGTNEIIIVFYMNEDDQRRIEYHCEEKWMEEYFRSGPTYQEARLWEKGGPFPQKFIPVPLDGPLFEMLRRMTVDKIVGDDK